MLVIRLYLAAGELGVEVSGVDVGGQGGGEGRFVLAGQQGVPL